MKFQNRKQILLVAVLLLLASIWIVWLYVPTRSNIYRGRFTDGFETSRFVPCGSEEKWWVEGNANPIYQAFYPDYKDKGLPEFQWKTGYVEVQGNITWRGSYGHMNAYDREIKIQKVIRVQLTVPDSCK